MKDQRNPERALEGMLARSLRRGARPGGPDCPDAQTLAAYCEGALSRSEAMRWETHLAACDRCQEQLAAVVRSAEATSLAPTAEPKRSPRPASRAGSWNWRWLAPIASAAVVMLALWAIDPASFRDRSPVQDAPEAPLRQADEDASRPAADDRQQGATAPPAEPEVRGPREELDQVATPGEVTFEAPRRFERANEVTGPPPAYGADDQVAQSRLESRDAARSLTEEPSLEAAERADAPQPASVPAPADSLRARRAREVSENRAAEVGAVGGLLADRSTSGRIASPSGAIVWRVVPPDRIERSSDGGETWGCQASAGVELLAGAAVSDLVCWVVGRAGTVLRTTNGEDWDRTAAPTDQDLVRIQAEDALNATVVAVDGSQYVTNDEGRTWTPGPPQ